MSANRPATIPYLLSGRLYPIYATILSPYYYQSESDRLRLNLRILHITSVRDRLMMSRASSELYKVEDCVFLRRIHEARESADDADNELWKWVHGETELYWTMGEGDDRDDEDHEGNDDDEHNEGQQG